MERLTQLHMLPLAYDREIKLTFYYKCRYGLILTWAWTLLHFHIVWSRTRRGSSSYLQTPFCKTSTFKSSYFNRIVNLWNFILRIAPPSTFLTLNSLIVLFVETPRKFITAKLSIRKPGSSSVLIICDLFNSHALFYIQKCRDLLARVI